MENPKKRLDVDELRENGKVQCRACFATWPRDSLDWTNQTQVQIGTNDSWGNWKVYSMFLTCKGCGELAVGDESITYKV